MTELRKRYLQDLRLRNYAPKTLKAYAECVSLFARYFKRSPEQLAPEHIREYQRYLAEQKKCSWSRFNQTVCALRFLYRNMLANGLASFPPYAPPLGECKLKPAAVKAFLARSRQAC
jgi:site-specific recombinase XerD